MNTAPLFNRLMDSLRTMTMHSQNDWLVIETDLKRQQDILARARAMMRAASLQYQKAVHNSTGAELQDLTHFWSPKRVLAMNKAFPALCIELEDVKVWNMLRRHERKFITAAYEMMNKPS